MKRVDEIAEMLGVTETYIRRLCRQGMIRAIKHGRDWIVLDVTKQAIEAYFDSKKHQIKIVKTAKYIKRKVVYRYKARKKKGKEQKPKQKVKYETWEDRSPSQRKWDKEEGE